MTVEQLIQELKKIKGQKKEIYVSQDPEGNGFRTIDEVATTKSDEGNDIIVIWPTDTFI